jgi:hypothetical protein
MLIARRGAKCSEILPLVPRLFGYHALFFLTVPEFLHHGARSIAAFGMIASVMLVGIGFAMIAVAMMRFAKARSKQNRNRILRDYVRRTY